MEYIFTKVLELWQIEVPIHKCIETFWSGLDLTTEIYSVQLLCCLG